MAKLSSGHAKKLSYICRACERAFALQESMHIRNGLLPFFPQKERKISSGAGLTLIVLLSTVGSLQRRTLGLNEAEYPIEMDCGKAGWKP